MKIDENGDAHGNYTLLTRQSLSSSTFNLSHGMIQTGYFVQTNDSVPVRRGEGSIVASGLCPKIC